jgi:flagellar hook-associated protein 1 FlgK
MAGLFGVLDVANRGLLVTQRGIQTTSHNIANVNTPGYSKQRQIVEPGSPLVTPQGALGTGVEPTSIERIHDAFTQAQILDHNAAMGSTDAQVNALSIIEEIVNEQRGEGLSVSLSRLYDAFSDLAAAQTPGAPVERQTLRGAAEGLLDTLHGADTQLRDLQDANHESIAGLLDDINSLTDRIADINRRIVEQETIAPANDLRDQRDLLMRDLSQKVEVNAYEDDMGAQIVYLPSGMPLVERSTAHTLVPIPDPTNPFSAAYSRIGHASTGGSVVDVTANIGGGELGGLLQARDTLIPAAIRSLDTIAYNLAESVNAVHQGGVGLNGVTGDFFLSLGAVEDAARNIALDPNIVASNDAIAAGTTTAPGDNSNAIALAALRDAASPLFLPGDPPGPATGPTRSVMSHAASVVAEIGQQARGLQQASAQQARVSEVLQNRRDEISGVTIDEEVTNLIALQAAFQANARVMDTVNRLLQDVIGLI